MTGQPPYFSKSGWGLDRIPVGPCPKISGRPCPEFFLRDPDPDLKLFPD